MWHPIRNWILFCWVYISPIIDSDVNEDLDNDLTDNQDEEAFGDDIVESSILIFLDSNYENYRYP